MRSDGHDELVAELERSAAEYAAAAERLAGLPRRAARRARRARDAGPPRPPTRSCRCWRPTPASSCSCRPAWPRTAAASATGRGGFWLPECAHAPWLDAALEEAGVRATCVELTDGVRARRRAAPAAARHRRRAGAVADRPRDRSRSSGARAATRRAPPTATTTASPPTTTACGETTATPYDPARPAALVAVHARDFVAPRPGARGGRRRVRVRARHRAARPLVVRGRAVAGGGARRGRAPGADADHARRRARAPRAGAGAAGRRWASAAGGRAEDLRTWSGPAVADIAWQLRTAELRHARARRAGPATARCASCWRCRRSDWAFLA